MLKNILHGLRGKPSTNNDLSTNKKTGERRSNSVFSKFIMKMVPNSYRRLFPQKEIIDIRQQIQKDTIKFVKTAEDLELIKFSADGYLQEGNGDIFKFAVEIAKRPNPKIRKILENYKDAIAKLPLEKRNILAEILENR